ncbi:MAG: hypothetical protein HOQ47_16400 [Streptomyces sp.]|nr:hypothetical protein [Streptomyces sp.]NUS31283.1 hypothetical protein [Streptomyces sp.]
MLDLTVRALAWILTFCTPRPKGRHRLGALPPLRYIPTDPRRQRDRRRAAYLATLGIDVGPTLIHGIRVGAPAATR